MKTFLSIFCLSSLFLISCNEEDELAGTYLYVETQCADPWTADGDSIEDYAEAAQSYLVRQHSIYYSALEKVSLAESAGSVCQACTCNASRPISIWLTITEANADILLQLGFTKVP